MNRTIRTLTLAVTLLLFAVLLPQMDAEAAASGTYGENLTWTLDDTGTLTVSGTGDMFDGTGFYSYHRQIKKAVILNGVTNIGNYAFSDCSGLTSVTIPDSVTWIGREAFLNCSGLASVTIPDSVTSIGDSAFYGCSSLKSVTIPDSVMSIGSSAFRDCSSLTSVTIPDSVTTNIGDGVFQGCKGLADEVGFVIVGRILFDYTGFGGSVAIPDSVTSISGGAFSDCSSLTSVTIPDSVTSIGDNAFRKCSGLTSVTIPDSVTSIGDYAFSGCSGLTSVTIGNSVTSIGSYAFYDCSGLTSVTIGDSVTSIGNSAFHGCSGLTSVMIGDSVTSIDDYAFDGCSGLTHVTIGNSVTNIGRKAFYGCTSLTVVILPASVISIQDNAFADCTGITDIYFAGDEKLWRQINLHNGYGPLIKANIHFNSTGPEEGKVVASGACGANLTWTLDSEGLLTISGTGAMMSCPWNPGYTEEIKTVVIKDGVTGIIGNAFENCGSLTSVTIPDSVTRIDGLAFYGCSGLTSVTIPDSVTSIGYGAFHSCSGLTSVTIPDGVTSIGYSAFQNCSGLASMTIGDSVTSIGFLAFENCIGLARIYITDLKAWCNINGLSYLTGASKYDLFLDGALIKDLVLPGDMTSIADCAFQNCSSLTSVTIPDGVTEIGKSAFKECTDLTTVVLPASVISVKNDAFVDCTGITDVYFAGDEKLWNLIDIYDGNRPLKAANIHFNSGGADGEKTVVISEPKIVTFFSAPVCYVTISCPEDISAVAYGVRYSAENRFLGADILDLVSGKENDMAVSFADGSYVRILVLDASTFAPLCAGSAAVAKP